MKNYTLLAILAAFILLFPAIALFYIFNHELVTGLLILSTSAIFNHYHFKYFEGLVLENIALDQENLYKEICLTEILSEVNTALLEGEHSSSERAMLIKFATDIIRIHRAEDIDEVLAERTGKHDG